LQAPFRDFPVTPVQPMKILLVRFSALGDVIQTLPILTMLRAGFPEAKIGWAIDAELVPAIEGHPDLDYIHVCYRKTWTRDLKSPALWKNTAKDMAQFLNEVKAIDYDVAVDAQGLVKTALLPYLAGIKRRIGYQHGRELSSLFYTEKYLTLKEYFDPSVFHLDHMAILAKAIGAAEVRYAIEPPVVSNKIQEKVAKLFENAYNNAAPVVAIAPATQWESKHWPEEHWVALLYQLLAKTNLNILMVGSRGDASLVERILHAFPQSQMNGRVLNVAGKTNVQEMYALYEHVDAAVGSDSAPLHIAGAVKVPVLIGIYGPTGYRRTPPIGSPHIQLFSTEGKLPCQPCHKRRCPLGTDECMTSIRPQDVLEGLLTQLANANIINSHQANVPVRN
jgi:heptosyltransferase I